MYCVNCGKPYEPSFKFCNHCGYVVPSTVPPEQYDTGPQPSVAADYPPEVVAEAQKIPYTEPQPERLPGNQTPATPLPAGPISAPQSAPYALFVSLVLGSVLLLSVLVFNVAEAIVRSRWEDTILSFAVVMGAALLARSARTVWLRVVATEPETDTPFKRSHRRVLGNTVIIALLFFTSAAIIGAAIGSNRDEAIHLAADLQRMTTVGNRISKARSGVEATILSYVEMYRTIAPDVQDLESTLGRLKIELVAYDSKFPSQHEETFKSIAGMETGLRRTALLKQQIAIAKQIQSLDPSEQVAAWRAQMLPLLAEEEALDKTK